MTNSTLKLNKYEAEALKDSMTKHIQILLDQMDEISRSRHLNNKRMKEIKRDLQKRKNLLQDILKKLD